jgi:hypothetical protein
VTGGRELDDREALVIEDEMDRLRIGGCLFNNRTNVSVNLASLEGGKGECTHEWIVSVVGIINPESGHQAETGIGEIESAEGR